MASTGKVALVTGAGTGIGKAAALALLKDGWSVVLAGRRIAPLEQTKAEAGADGARALVVTADVAQPESVRELFEKAKAKFGRLDMLFNNAGINSPGIPLEELSFEHGNRWWTSTSPAPSCAHRKPSAS